jgi:hypothetical protein
MLNLLILAVAGGVILLECCYCCTLNFTNPGSCWWDNFTRMLLLLYAYFTNPGSCWWDNFTKMLLLLQDYFTNTGICWWGNFTRMLLLLAC